MFWGITKIVMEQANMDRAGPRICDQRAAQLNVNFKTPGYIKINQKLLHAHGGGMGGGEGASPWHRCCSIPKKYIGTCNLLFINLKQSKF